MTIINDLLSPDICFALGKTLIHALWQSAGIALLLAVWLTWMKKKSSEFKYNSAYISLLLVFLSATITFWLLMPSSIAPPSPGPLRTLVGELINPDFLLNGVLDNSQSDTSAQWNTLIVFGWILGVIVLSLKFVGGLVYLRRVQQSTRKVEDQFEHILRQLGKRLKVPKQVKLLESWFVQSPIMLGHFKPLILLPVGLLTGINAEQMEYILAHELAHIKRNDFLFNLFQSLMEIIFFYLPPVWWISNKIRNERENCCDDMAISLTGNHVSYAKTLLVLQEFKTSQTSYAMSINSNKSVLMQRIKRIVNPSGEDKSTSGKWIAGIILSSVIIVMLASGFIFRSYPSVTFFQEDPTPKPIPPVKAPKNIAIPEPPELPETINVSSKDMEWNITDESGKSYRLRIEFSSNGQLDKVFLNEKEIAKDKVLNNKNIMDFLKKEHDISIKRNELDVELQTQDLDWSKEELKIREEEMKHSEEDLVLGKKELEWQQQELKRRGEELTRQKEDIGYDKQDKKLPKEVIERRKQEELRWQAEEKKREEWDKQRELKDQKRREEDLVRQKRELQHREIELVKEKKELSLQEEELALEKEFRQVIEAELKKLIKE